MSTRANIILKDKYTTLYFYRHSDGYPETTGESLKEFVKLYSEGLRANVSQSAGWLVVHGHSEYLQDTDVVKGKVVTTKKRFTAKPDKKDPSMGWKVGAYEPTDGLSGDVEYVYIIDLDDNTLSCRVPNRDTDFWNNPSMENTLPCKKFKNTQIKAKE
jgi:hypothetical protein